MCAVQPNPLLFTYTLNFDLTGGKNEEKSCPEIPLACICKIEQPPTSKPAGVSADGHSLSLLCKDMRSVLLTLPAKDSLKQVLKILK